MQLLMLLGTVLLSLAAALLSASLVLSILLRFMSKLR
jgi:hypothetical protein